MGKKFWANIILCVFIGGVASLVLANIPSALTPKGLLVSEPEASPEAAALMDKVILVDYALAENPDQMVKGEFIVENSSDKAVRNIVVLCDFFGDDGKYLDREQWLLDSNLPPGKAMQHSTVARRFVNTATKNMQCRIVNFQVVSEPFFKLHRVEGGHHGAAEAEAAAEGHGEAAAHH